MVKRTIGTFDKAVESSTANAYIGWRSIQHKLRLLLYNNPLLNEYNTRLIHKEHDYISTNDVNCIQHYYTNHKINILWLALKQQEQ